MLKSCTCDTMRQDLLLTHSNGLLCKKKDDKVKGSFSVYLQRPTSHPSLNQSHDLPPAHIAKLDIWALADTHWSLHDKPAHQAEPSHRAVIVPAPGFGLVCCKKILGYLGGPEGIRCAEEFSCGGQRVRLYSFIWLQVKGVSHSQKFTSKV